MGPSLFGSRGLAIMSWEALLFSPLVVYAFWPRRPLGTRAPVRSS